MVLCGFSFYKWRFIIALVDLCWSYAHEVLPETRLWFQSLSTSKYRINKLIYSAVLLFFSVFCGSLEIHSPTPHNDWRYKNKDLRWYFSNSDVFLTNDHRTEWRHQQRWFMYMYINFVQHVKFPQTLLYSFNIYREFKQRNFVPKC